MAKKDFGQLKSPIGNTAMNFISADPVNEEVEKKTAKIVKKAGRPKAKEKRSQRVVLLLKPSLYEKMKEAADEQDKSVNEFYESLLKDYLKK